MTRKEEPKDRKTAVLEATLKLIAEQGFHGTPMSQIASQANISVGTIYHYFSSKEDLINELYIFHKTRLSKKLSSLSVENLAPKDHFILVANTIFNYFLKNPNELLFVEQYYNSPIITATNYEKAMRLFETGQKNMEKAICDNIMKNLPVEMIHALFQSSIIALIKVYWANKSKISEGDIAKGFEAIWDMLKK